MSVMFSVERARFAQRVIASRVLESDALPSEVRYVAGVDVTYSGPRAIAAAAVVDARTLGFVTSSVVELEVHVPYIPTLLAFREAGPMIAALRKLDLEPDVLIVDGNGRLHPLGAGIACQVGLAVDKPTIGVAKKLLCGEVGEWSGREAPVLLAGKVVGVALRTSSKPIYVSVGHKISLPTAVALVSRLTRKGARLPEPLRLAHETATKYARRVF
ncbi:MAG: endonuclease V [Thermofilaceae archaeon]